MAPAVIPADPALRAAVMQCVTQPAADPAVQQAAIQVYRLIPVPEEASHFIVKGFSLEIGQVIPLCRLLIGGVFDCRPGWFSCEY